MTIHAQIGDLAYRGNYLDLDPDYKDAYGLPLLGMTYDRGPNERRAAAYREQGASGWRRPSILSR